MDSQTTTQTAPHTVTLAHPIERGEQRIETIQIREPNAGNLRGINLTEILQLNVSALIELLPRITEPPLIKQEVAALKPADLVALGVEVVGFFVPQQTQE